MPNNTRDPLSHRIIEKRRRDRMNNCLADLSRLIPSSYLKKGRGRIEKTEIIEMAIKHVKHLESHLSAFGCSDGPKCRLTNSNGTGNPINLLSPTSNPLFLDELRAQFRFGFQEAISEMMRFMVELEGMYPGEGLILRLVTHLQNHLERFSDQKVDQQLAHRTRSASVSSALSGSFSGTSCSTPTPGGSQTPTIMPVMDIEVTRKLETGSQLREMLENASIGRNRMSNGRSSTTVHSDVIKCESVSNKNSCVNDTKYQNNNSNVNETFRSFKKGIKERFQSDMKMMVNDDSNSTSPLKSRQMSPNYMKRKVEEMECRSSGSDSGSNQSQARTNGSDSGYYEPYHLHLHKNQNTHLNQYTKTHVMNNSNNKPVGVINLPPSTSTSQMNSINQVASMGSIGTRLLPGFVLHPGGTFYVPVTLDSGLLMPGFVNMTDAQSLLHPVSITVNFQHPPQDDQSSAGRRHLVTS